jgi:hypothetical protein
VAALPGGALAVVVRGTGGPITFNPGLPDALTFSTSVQSGVDGFVVRYEADGRLGWIARAAHDSWSLAYLDSCAAHPDGSVVVAGTAAGPMTFGEGEPNETAPVPTQDSGVYGWDIVLASYAPDGTLRWARRTRSGYVGGLYGDVRVATTDGGGVAITGSFDPATTFAVGEAGETTLPGGGGSALPAGGRGSSVAFAGRYDADGRLAWVRQIGDGGTVFATGLAVMPGGEFVAAGYANRDVTFGEGEPAETVFTPIGSLDLYFAHHAAADGQFRRLWRVASATSPIPPRAVVANAADGGVVAAFTYDAAGATFAPGTPRARTFESQGGDLAIVVLDPAQLDEVAR